MTGEQFEQWLIDPGRRPLVMGVLNVTPDSFSDGGRFTDPGAAVAQAHLMASEGADLIDIGGESTRPGAERVAAAEQIRRIVPVFQGLGARPGAILSVDTTLAAVAEAALDAGATLVNDISAGRDDPDLLPLVARKRAAIILMHMQGQPRGMQIAPAYEDVTAEIGQFLKHRMEAATRAGIEPHRILIDPGIGFGKTLEHNLELLRRMKELADLGSPLVIGTSRKSFIGTVTGVSDPSRRVLGTAATVAWSIANGAAVVRVHDVGPMVEVVRMVRAIQTPSGDFPKPA